MNHDKTTLNQVTDDRRADDELFIKSRKNGEFMLAKFDETLMIDFDKVSAFIEYGSEWADFKGDRTSVTLCNEQNELWPHWVFEELQHIEQEGKLRPVDDYETTYQLKDNRGIKGRR